MSPTDVHAAVANGIPVPDLDLPVRIVFLVEFRIYVVLLVPRQAGSHHGQLAQNYRACARPVRTI